MLRSEAITIIKRGLGFRQTQDSAIVAALKQVQRDLEAGKTLPNWMLVFDASIAVTAGTAVATLPAGFLRVHEDYPLYWTNSENARVFIPRRNYTEAYQAFVASGSEDDAATVMSSGSYPQVYVQRNKTTIEFIPTPTVTFTAFVTYYKAGTILDSDVENVWLANAANYIIGLAGMQVAGDLRDAGALQKFTTMAKMGSQSYLGDIVEDELAGRPLIMGRNN
jgi:hypothetical protein